MELDACSRLLSPLNMLLQRLFTVVLVRHFNASCRNREYKENLTAYINREI